MKSIMKNINLKKELLILILLFSALFAGCKKDNAFDPDLALNVDTIRITKTTIASNVLVFSNTSWRVDVDDPTTTTWLSLSEQEHITTYNGAGRTYFRFAAQANADGVVRLGELIISTAKSRKTVIIRQSN